MKRISDGQRQQFAREFPGLEKVPLFEWVKKIDVQRVDPHLLRGSGIVSYCFNEFRNTFYAVYSGGEVQSLRANRIGWPAFDSTPNIIVPSNGEQIFRISSTRPPDFIVEVRGEDDSHGNTVDVCIVYKADKFDWKSYFEDEVHPRLKEAKSS